MALLEPHQCTSFVSHPTLIADSDEGVVFRRKRGNAVFRIQYKYDNIMSWEYDLIEQFFNRMKGPFEEFYVVNWSKQYRPVQFNSSTSFTLLSCLGLTSSLGYIGNTLLIYNSDFDAYKGQTDKQLLNISSIDTNTNLVTVSTEINSGLRNTRSMVYVLVPSVFEIDSLTPDYNATCIAREMNYFKGFGTKPLFGPVVSVNIGFRAIATLP